MKTALFICTGNYYRSRFAEEMFNFNARNRGLEWRAESAGLRVPETRHQNPGPISNLVLEALEEHQIPSSTHQNEPRQISEQLLANSQMLIATSLIEHKAMIMESYPHYLDKITFWEVEDVEFEDPKSALYKLATSTISLLDQLANKN